MVNRSFRAAAVAACSTIALAAGPAHAVTRTISTTGVPTIGEFIDSIGVNTHWNYTDTPYGASYTSVSQKLIDSGIKHMRAGCNDPAGNGSSTKAIRDLRTRGSISSMVAMEPSEGTIANQIACIKAHNTAVAGAVDSVEGPNEPDTFWQPHQSGGQIYGGNGYPTGAKNFLCDVFTAINADSATAALPVVGMSFGINYETTDYSSGELAPCVDWGNAHPYPGNGEPFGANFSYAGLSFYFNEGTNPGINVAEEKDHFNQIVNWYGTKPMAASETGYSTYDGGTPDLALHAKYMPRLFAEYFRLGIKRTFAYEFVDEFSDSGNTDQQSHYGLLKNDLTAKPAYTAMKALMGRMHITQGDPPLSPTPPSRTLTLTWTMPSGYTAHPEFVRSMLLKRADNGYALFLWHEIAGQSKDTPGVTLTHPAVSVTVAASTAFVSAKRYAFDSTWAFANTASWTNASSVPVSIDDKVSVLFFK